MTPSIYPPPLKKGATLGIFAPAGQLQDVSVFLQGVEILQGMGFKIKYPQDLWPGSEYLADSDEYRGDEFNRLLKDDEINGLVAMRGGYGCLRMLDKIDAAMNGLISVSCDPIWQPMPVMRRFARSRALRYGATASP